MADLDKNDIQGIVFTGYPKLEHAVYVLLEFVDVEQACAWLRGVARVVSTGEERPRTRAVNIAFTAAGLRILELSKDTLESFAREFQEGMSGHEHRSRALGDTEQSAPENWLWGGPNKDRLHALLMLFAVSAEELEKLKTEQRSVYEGAARELYVQDSITLENRREHFGFADGSSQPRIEGARAAGDPSAAVIRAGEFLFGYENQYDKLPNSPSVSNGAFFKELPPTKEGRRDLGRNGTYLVVRQLAQDVEGFWRSMYEQSIGPDGTGSRDEAIRLAAKCVGRWPSGAPLVRCPNADNPKYARDNSFGYHREDPDGLACPIGSHIRRANPRDSLEPDPEESTTVVNRHRIMRRGRAYGPPLAPFEKDRSGSERGLFFMCLNTNIRRQFEFIQQTWLNNAKFDGLYDDADPIVGTGGTLTVPGQPVRRQLEGLPRFVTVRGGEYFFVPGIRALRAIARAPGR